MFKPQVSTDPENPSPRSRLIERCGQCLLVTAFIPSLIWIFTDKRVWPWDPAWYGEVSVELFYRLTHTPEKWLELLFSAFSIKAPGVAWLGEFFVPLGMALDSIEFGLLFSILTTQFVALLLSYRLLKKLTHNSIIAALSSLLIVAAPLSVAITRSLFNSEVHQNLKSIHRILQKEFDSQDIF